MDKSKPPKGWVDRSDGHTGMPFVTHIGAVDLGNAWISARDNAQPFVDEAVERIAAWLEGQRLEIRQPREFTEAIRRGDWKR